MTNLDSIFKKQRHYFANKGLSSQGYGFSSSHVWMWELDHKESWVPKNWCFWTVVLEKTLESPLDCKEIQSVHPKGDQCWIFIRRTDVEAEAPILWLPDANSWLIGKDPDAGKDWRQEEKGRTGWDGWMVSPTQWTWVWASSGSWWWTGRPGMLQSMGSQRVGHDWVTDLNWTEQRCLLQGLEGAVSYCVACGILAPWPGIEPMLPTVALRSPNLWTVRGVLGTFSFIELSARWLGGLLPRAAEAWERGRGVGAGSVDTPYDWGGPPLTLPCAPPRGLCSLAHPLVQAEPLLCLLQWPPPPPGHGPHPSPILFSFCPRSGSGWENGGSERFRD